MKVALADRIGRPLIARLSSPLLSRQFIVVMIVPVMPNYDDKP